MSSSSVASLKSKKGLEMTTTTKKNKLLMMMKQSFLLPKNLNDPKTKATAIGVVAGSVAAATVGGGYYLYCRLQDDNEDDQYLENRQTINGMLLHGITRGNPNSSSSTAMASCSSIDSQGYAMDSKNLQLEGGKSIFLFMSPSSWMDFSTIADTSSTSSQKPTSPFLFLSLHSWWKNCDMDKINTAVAASMGTTTNVANTTLCERSSTKKKYDDPSYPDLSRFGKHSYLKRYLSPEVYKQLKDKKTSNGVSLEDIIRSGVALPWGAKPIRGCGIYAGDAESYKVFAKILVPILEDYHHFRVVSQTQKRITTGTGKNRNKNNDAGRNNKKILRRQVTNLNPGYVLRQKLDPEGQYILSTRMRVARSLDGYPFSPVISRQQRRELEQIFQECVSDFQNDTYIGGKYLPIMDMTNDEHDTLIDKHILFHDPDEYSISAGLGRDWPDGRGVYVHEPPPPASSSSASHSDESSTTTTTASRKTMKNNYPEVMIWLNAEDHFRIISMSKGGDLLQVFTRLSALINALETSLQRRGHKFCIDPELGFLNTSPENLGTALRASVFVKLPRLGKQPGFEELLDRLRLEASTRFHSIGTNSTLDGSSSSVMTNLSDGSSLSSSSSSGGGRYTGIFDIANAERLGQSEVQLINTMINGVGRLIALEKQLERGEKVDLSTIG